AALRAVGDDGGGGDPGRAGRRRGPRVRAARRGARAGDGGRRAADPRRGVPGGLGEPAGQRLRFAGIVTDTWTTSRGTAVRMRTWAAEDPSVTLLVVHGLVAATDVLASARPGLNPYEVLAAEGMTVVGLDLPGHGPSGGPRGQ